MATEDDGHRILHIKLKGRKSDDGRIVSQTMRRVRNTLSKNGGSIKTGRKRATAKMRGTAMPRGYKPTLQRCAVRMSYSANKVAGQWAAHGRYIARDGASTAQDRDTAFSDKGKILAADTLSQWQQSGDPRLFKFILSPEFGQDMSSMEKFTKDFMAKLEKDLGVGIEWLAVDHYNTAHPHVHIALRGIDTKGNELLLQPEYVKTTLRHRAQEAATEQLGIRTERQQHTAFEREVTQRRFTSLDRMLQKRAQRSPDGKQIGFDDPLPKGANAKRMRLYQIQRLVALEKMGLASVTGHMKWVMDSAAESTLRSMQESGDILKTMYSARDLQSDPRMPLQKAGQLKAGQLIEGRLIAAGQDDDNSKPYLLLESVEGIVHHIYQTSAMQKARGAGGLKRGDYLTVEGKELDRDGKKVVATVMKNHGNGHKLLSDRKHLAAKVMHAVRTKKALPEFRPAIGWLGEYQRAIAAEATELLKAGAIRPGADGMEISPTRQPRPLPQAKKGVSR